MGGRPVCHKCFGLLDWDGECRLCSDPPIGLSKSVQRRLADPTIPLTQVEAMLREAYSEGVRECAHGLSPANPLRGIVACSKERKDEWIANKIKEARQ